MSTIVLLLAPEAPGTLAADALRRALDAEIDLHTSARAALTALRLREYTLVLLDEGAASSDNAAAEEIYSNAAAPVLEFNLVLCGMPRLVRQARAALFRRSRDLALAEAAAAARLQSDLKQTLTGLLLESELALRQATPEQEPRLRELVQMAGILRDRLRIDTRPTSSETC